MELDLKNDTLILVAHGSEANSGSSAAVRSQSEELRRRGVFAEVLLGFRLEKPTIQEVIGESRGIRVFVVPFFVSEGLLTEEVIPREMGLLENGALCRRQSRGNQTIYYSRPLGTHPQMTELLLTQASEVVARHPFPRVPKPSETALFIVGHGTLKNENSRKSIELQVDLIRAKGIYREVHGVFLEEAPTVAACYDMSQCRNLVVVPFFMGNGLHVVEDIPVMLGEGERVVQSRLKAGQPTWRNPTEKKGRLVWYSESVGNGPELTRIILENVRDVLSIPNQVFNFLV